MCKNKDCDGNSLQLPRREDGEIHPTLPSSGAAPPAVLWIRASGKNHRFGFLDGPADPGMVYRHLRKLEEDGFVSSTWDTSGTRPRPEVLQPAQPKGEELLRNWIPFMEKNLKSLEKFLKSVPGNHFNKREERKMCCIENKSGCQCPKELKGKPEDCTPEQIKECHGTKAKHPCVPKRPKKK